MDHLKRKRSDEDIEMTDAAAPAPSTSSPAAASSAAPSPATMRHMHPGGRTLKRYRDARPSPEEIHRNTLNLLYAAQHSAAAAGPAQLVEDDAEGVDGAALDAPVAAAAGAVDRSQTSLDRFFTRLPAQQQQA